MDSQEETGDYVEFYICMFYMISYPGLTSEELAACQVLALAGCQLAFYKGDS